MGRRTRRTYLRRRLVVVVTPVAIAAAAVVFSRAGASRPASASAPAHSARTVSVRSGHKSSPRRAAHRAGTPDPFTSPAMLAYLRGRKGDVTAALYDLTSKKTYLLHPGVAEQTASIVKVDILATLLWQAQSASRPLTEDEQELAQGMIEESDNDDATALWDEVGGSGGIAHFDSLVGLDSISPNTQGYWGETTTTALDQVDLLKQLVLPGSLLDASSRSYELGLMENVIPYDRWGVSSGPTPGTTVALKNGWVTLTSSEDWQINSIGWIDGDGRDYLVAVLTSGNLTEQYGIDTIEGISELLWPQLRSGKPVSKTTG